MNLFILELGIIIGIAIAILSLIGLVVYIGGKFNKKEGEDEL